ncbi:type II CRISPR RNA-guided endonuclease Cas9 [Shinella yambaruensis]|uniref:CRISPR-associated endonuclease Cas9 n=1 Tax=Shinella yambaruensis TaxID=415996 RepID=A0ABQ5ZGT3_9HYPH|nr:type II CRISPR RNA-guided endonuclease Cas9 [Shinella yambaruensis]MCJ8029896.1 type II CRISPR RNA-guided endonuclease Cas9 [Shinella yambaruensis]MCU7984150.1 type II CRISPR RNA-guided endonuclease Cas9 [Shinella yambaruensis]GLR52034.1 CRISPR-associated endonuclease Cas9 [Shinella yambaruensis]
MAGYIKTLGLDLGTNSLGWAIIETRGEPGENDEGRIVASGVRIFSQSEMAGRDPQSKASLAVARRQARGSRRQRDRYLKRRERLVDLLVDLGLMPADKAARAELVKNHGDGKTGDLSSSVYALRARALDEALSPYEIGRAIFHLNQRRGFKSNRKADSNDPEQGVISEGMRSLDEKMAEAGARTIGEWLHMRRLQGLPVRARIAPDGEGYAFYPSRDALEREFDRIMARQTLFHPDLLTDAVIRELREVIFHQRPLRPVKPGKCSYNPLEERLAKAHPLFQKFRLLKELNELEIVGEDQKHIKLTPEQRDALALQLRTSLTKQGKVPFSKLRGTLKLGREVRFNKETDNRSDLEGDVVYFRMSRPECFGNRWADLPVERQAAITERLRTEPDYNTLMNWLKAEAGLDEAHARAVADTPVPDGFGRLGRSALTALIDALENEVGEGGFVITEAEAAKRVYGRTNSEADPNRKGVDQLPKYQEVLARHIPPGTGEPDDPYDDFMGRITNPTVHIALNQLRRVVNALIRTYGKPDRIAIEVGRELKMNDRERDEINRRIARNTKAAIERGVKLTETFRQLDTGYNRLRLELWEDLNQKPENRVCIYCGKAIAGHMLFNGETDIDHILPYSKTLDDSKANRILCCTSCNREKKNRPPSSVPQWRSRYGEILARVTTLPKPKQWRFGEDAMTRFGEEEGFLARQLTDMQYISRLALTYLAHLYDYEEVDLDGIYKRHARVRALPGRMTEMLRRQWGLNELLHDHNLIGGDVAKPKNRLDHRHHAIDAIVIACTSRALIQRLATASAAAEERGAERVVERIDPPWSSFREDVRAAVGAIVVSHKPDHGTVSREGYARGRGQTAGKLHNDTAYGYTGEKDASGNDIVVRRIAITDIRNPADIMKIRTNAHGHSELRDRLYEATRGLEGKAFEQAVLDFVKGDVKFRGIRHVRITEVANPVWITHGGGRYRKGYLPGGNDRFDVWELADGKWDAEVVTTFDAHRPGFVPRMRLENHNARKIMSLKKGDMVAYDDPDSGKRIIAIVRKFDQRNKQLYLDPHNEAGNLDRREKEKTYKPLRPMPNPLKKYRPRQVRIDEIGQVFDPGPWWEKQDG